MCMSTCIHELLRYIVEQIECEGFARLSAGEQLGLVTVYMLKIADSMSQRDAYAMANIVHRYYPNHKKAH